MDPQIERLLDAFRQVKNGPPREAAAFVAELPEVGILPSPWETWTLIGLVRHRERQFWVADVIRTRLRGAPADLAAAGALGHPDGVKQRGSVPGMPEWEYFFHGRGCCVTHKVNGDAIDVDFWDDLAEYFDVFFYTRYLESLRHPEPPEVRLRELYRSTRPLRIAVDDLIAAGALAPLPGRDTHPPRVADAVLDYADDIEAFCTLWANPSHRLWLGALVGDWLATQDAAPDDPMIAARAETCRCLRRERLLKVTGNQSADALHGLAELGAAEAAVEQAFRGQPTGLVSAALDIVEGQDDPKWCPLVYGMYSRVNPAGSYPEPRLWMRSLTFPLKHRHRTDELLAALPKAAGTEIGGSGAARSRARTRSRPAADPQRAARRHSREPHRGWQRYSQSSASPGASGELLGALEASDDQEKTADARAALLESGDEEAQNAVLAWAQLNPHENEMGSLHRGRRAEARTVLHLRRAVAEGPGVEGPLRDGPASRPGDESPGRCAA